MKLAIIGTGKIVHEALFALEPVDTIELTAVFSRPHSKEKAEELAEKYGIKEIYTDYDALLKESEAECVYIGLVNSAHFEYAKKALEAGKHVILEKPLTSTAAEAERLVSLARERRLYLLEAITTLHSDTFRHMKEELPNLGNLRALQCNYSQYSSRYDKYLQGEVEPAFNPELSGGALYDINLYNVYLTIGLLGAPKSSAYFPNCGFNGIDTSGMAVLQYPSAVAVCTGAKDSDSPSFAIVQGEKGWMRMLGKPNLMDGLEVEVVDEKVKETVANASGGQSRAVVHRNYKPEPVRHRMTQEFIDFARMIENKDDKAAEECMETSLAVIRTLEQARKSAGIRFGVDEE